MHPHRVRAFFLQFVTGLALALSFQAANPPALCADEPVRRIEASRNWSKYPAIVEVGTTHDVFAVGDVHGDYGRLVALLAAGKIIAGAPAPPEQVQWRAGPAILVCTGDLIDKGDHSVRVLLLFKALQAAAAKAGGQVIVTMGNHEAEFLADPVHGKKAVEFLKDLQQQGLKPEDVGAGRDALGLGVFLRSLPMAARVNDWFFVHAGNTHGRTLQQLRTDLQKGVDARGYGAPVLLDADSLLEARLHPLPWWEKAGDTPAASRDRLARCVHALGVQHLVVGHQPAKVAFSDETQRKKGTIIQKFDGLIFLIDVGMSSAVDYSQGALLRIVAGDKPTATALYPDGTSQQLWTSQN